MNKWKAQLPAAGTSMNSWKSIPLSAPSSLVKFFNSENATGSLFHHCSERVAGDR
jgi:hypothetical protein